MKQKTITLPQAVKLFPESYESVACNNIPDNFYALSYKEKYANLGHTKIKYVLSNKPDKLFFGKKIITVTRCGKQFYLKTTWTGVIIIEKSRIRLSNVQISDLKKFLSIVELDKVVEDLIDVEQKLVVNKIVIADILRRKIYGQETFYRCILNKVYRLKGFNWKLFKEYVCSSDYHVSIYDLAAFTKDLQKSLSVLIEASKNKNHRKYNLLLDMLQCAIKLNQIIDFGWSDKRLEEEHIKQNRILNYRTISEKQVIPIHQSPLNLENIRMLNTEQDVYLEGLNMHHCLYTCYWGRIKNGKYLAFHMSSPESCTFSFRLDNNDVILDQRYLAYDRPVSEETNKLIESFLSLNQDRLKSLLEEKIKAIPDKIQYGELPSLDDIF